MKRFYSPALDELLNATRKSDMKSFTPRSQSICRTDEGNTKEFLTEPRAVEEFLKTIENKYNGSVALIETARPNSDAIYTIAGFVSYLLVCTPAAVRLNAAAMEIAAELAVRQAEARGALPAPPPELAGETLSGLLDKGGLRVHVDQKMLQAIGIADILGRVIAFGNCKWEALVNEHDDCPFFTSDFPIANQKSDDETVAIRVFPLLATLAIRITPDRGFRGPRDFTFANFSFSRMKAARTEVVSINRTLVKAAEDLVLYEMPRRG